MTEEQNLLKQMLQPSRIYPVVLILAMFIYWKYWRKPAQMKAIQEQIDQQKKQEEEYKTIGNIQNRGGQTAIKGLTMGTIEYKVLYYDTLNRDFRVGIDSLLKSFNGMFSTYIPNSLISKFNTGNTLPVNTWIKKVHKTSERIYTETDGVFDPTIKPLVSFWGFGSTPNEASAKDSSKIDSLKQLVGYNKINLEKGSLTSYPENNLSLDYGAIAKGYAVDLVSEYLIDRAVKSFMVEIGGEIRTGNVKPEGKQWVLGIEDPTTLAREIKFRIKIDNQSVATSGNYRNIRKDSATGIVYQHTINPKIGFPVRNSLLSVTVINPDCLDADAYATALMVMGVEKAIVFAKEKELIISLMYSKGDSIEVYHSEEFKKYLFNE